MNTLAERLKFALYRLGLNQAEAAKKSGISQQSINYIIRNNLSESRLSSRVADGLGLNSEWLIHGRGEMISPDIYKIPVIADYLSLQLYFNDRPIDKDTSILLTHRIISTKPFAVKIEKNKICICTNQTEKEKTGLIDDFLLFNDSDIKVIKKNESNNINRKDIFRIVEWRVYDVEI